ncbi:flagellar motor protein MotB [Paenibacillus sp. F411]|uniref:OmpA/MotB family protein n=1 Tax=Paenibacillus sp. F411 TaxID=2820239 RepID=UPI001AAE5802|nr:flagellar motor protein MotB [Paenibacillus sp. F411]MBO2944804.1 flagellar motor protein MotB [Paenibacillus sp. F411]
MRRPIKSTRRERRRQGAGDQRDRWMITYADLITLLLIFFVVLFAMSRLDTEKYDRVTQSLQATFQSGDSLLEHGSGLIQGGSAGDSGSPDGDGAAGDSVWPDEDGNDGAVPDADGESDTDPGTSGPMTQRELAFREQEQELADFMEVIKQYVALNQLEGDIFIADEPQGIAITLSDRFLFDPGQAQLKDGAAPVLGKLASLFQDLSAVVSIEGHTDNVPVGLQSPYADNWELSGARAMSVLRFFLDRQGLSPDSFQYAGYADTRPAGDNSTAAGRQKNRRVEITVLRQLRAE